MVLVDTHVLLDLVADDPRWAVWSVAQLDAASATDSLAMPLLTRDAQRYHSYFPTVQLITPQTPD